MNKQQLKMIALASRRKGENPSRVLAAAIGGSKTSTARLDRGTSPGGPSTIYTDVTENMYSTEELARELGILNVLSRGGTQTPRYQEQVLGLLRGSGGIDTTQSGWRDNFIAQMRVLFEQTNSMDAFGMVEKMVPASYPAKGEHIGFEMNREGPFGLYYEPGRGPDGRRPGYRPNRASKFTGQY